MLAKNWGSRPELLTLKIFTQPWYRVKLNLRQKRQNFVKLKSRQIVIISKLITKTYNFDKISYNYLIYALWKTTFAHHFLELLRKKSVKMQPTQIYASQECFTQPLVMMVETFRGSSPDHPLPPLSAIVTISLTPPPPSVSQCQQLDTPPPLLPRQLCPHI